MTPQDSIIEVNDRSFVERVVESRLPVLLAFCHPDCPGAGEMLSLLTSALPRCPGLVTIAKASPSESPGLAARFGVVPGPSLFLLREGMVRFQYIGELSRRELDELLARVRADGAAAGKRSIHFDLAQTQPKHGSSR